MEDQRRREEAGLTWKSASTLERQRKRARGTVRARARRRVGTKVRPKAGARITKAQPKAKAQSSSKEEQVKGVKGKADTPPSAPRVPPAPPLQGESDHKGFPAPCKAGARLPPNRRAKGGPEVKPESLEADTGEPPAENVPEAGAPHSPKGQREPQGQLQQAKQEEEWAEKPDEAMVDSQAGQRKGVELFLRLQQRGLSAAARASVWGLSSAKGPLPNSSFLRL